MMLLLPEDRRVRHNYANLSAHRTISVTMYGYRAFNSPDPVIGNLLIYEGGRSLSWSMPCVMDIEEDEIRALWVPVSLEYHIAHCQQILNPMDYGATGGVAYPVMFRPTVELWLRMQAMVTTRTTMATSVSASPLTPQQQAQLVAEAVRLRARRS